MSAKSDRAVVHLLGDIAQDESADTRRAVLPSPGARVLPNLPITFTCEHCESLPAVCIGRYENMEDDGFACGDCCGHGCEDGHCDALDTNAGQARAIDRVLLLLERPDDQEPIDQRPEVER
jgi:hypothetical protein